MSGYHTGIHLFNYEVTISDRGGVVLERVHLSLPADSHPSFRQHLFDGLLNLGISVATHHGVKYLKKS